MRIKIFFSILVVSFLYSCGSDNSSDDTPPMLEKPAVSTINVDAIGSSNATIVGEVTELGGFVINNHGFCLSQSSNPSINDNPIFLGSNISLGEFTSSYQNLESNKQYYVRSFIQYDGDQIEYGNILTFSTLEAVPWNELSPYPGGNSAHASSFVIDDILYVGTGYYLSNNFYKYSIDTDSWNQIADLPSEGRNDAVGFAIDGYGYVGLGTICDIPLPGSGCGLSFLVDFWKYDVVNNSWTQIADFPETIRQYPISFVINDKAYVSALTPPDNDIKLWEYDPLINSWTEKSSYPGACDDNLSAFVVNGKAYVGLGLGDIVNSDGNCNDIWEYDPTNDIWNEKNDFPGSSRFAAQGSATDNYGYLFGGMSRVFPSFETTYYNEMWKYDATDDNWQLLETTYPGNARVFMISEYIDGKIIYGLGADEITFYEDFWAFNPEYD